jgi:hypothetical protein
MHILIGLLIGLAVTTALIILWTSGNLFACVFLSIPPGLGLLVIAMRDDPALPIYPTLCLGSLVVIWAPRYFLYRRSRRQSPPHGLEWPNVPMPRPPQLYITGVKPYVAKSGDDQGELGVTRYIG